MGLGSGFFLVVGFFLGVAGFLVVVLFFGGVFVVVFPEVFVVALFTEGFFAGCLDVGVGFFALGLPGAVVFWRVEVVFELFSFAFGVVVGFFLGGIILQVHESQVVRGQEYDTIRDCFQHSQG